MIWTEFFSILKKLLLDVLWTFFPWLENLLKVHICQTDASHKKAFLTKVFEVSGEKMKT